MRRMRYGSAIAALAFAAALGASTYLRAAQPAGDAVTRGRAIYQERCVECHGVSGKGDGRASAFLTPRPRDFAAGRYKIRSTETGSIPTDDDLIQSVRQGLYGSAMPAWSTLLSDAQIRDVVVYIKTLSPRFLAEQPAVVSLGPQVPSSPESVARGQAVYERMQCGKCHGSDGRGANAVATDFQDDWGQPLNAANLAEPWTFHGGSTSREIYLRFRTGMSGTPMPSFRESATDAEMWDLANYVGSLARKPVWSMSADELKAQYASEEAGAKADPVKRGKYLVDTHLCAICHSPIDEQSHLLRGMYMAGGQV